MGDNSGAWGGEEMWEVEKKCVKFGEMSDVSCSGPYFFHDNFYLDRMQSPQELESTEIESRENTSRMESTPEVVVIGSNDGDDVAAAVDGVCECIQFGEEIKKLKDGTTTSLHRHISDCPKLRVVNTIHPDSDFKLNKCILSFIDVPPPYSGLCIYDSLFKCLKEWNIETKVATLMIDNVTTNDVVATKLMEIMNLQKKLVVGGSYSMCGQLHIFSELSKQMTLSKKHLILDVSTRWNATYVMLSTALEFTEVFVNYVDQESTYKTLPTSEDWDKVEVICSFLGLFNEVTKIISGSEYPTSNLFLSELYGIKEALDDLSLDESKYMRDMALKMKKIFDKYSGTCNMLISIGAVLDPRYNMKLVEFSFSSIYSTDEAPKQMKIVQDTLTKMFEEYVEQHKAANVVQISSAPNKSESRVKSGYIKLSFRVGI
ncbi:zinc finger BED domain-containing protein RICESLEEPER 2-like [Cynara cardunculus var. scolymus]|uniref:zinc finger BED domain-containing protein RICESLEEPER 2-like n=1 Tax=Cynara cardunculus var. scolymus TaxID=59895 RepID=UPI000D62A4E0|nr:zinc finger BED domain-containing protein RICESLEEPER 2-like [Cynara cardunculus var. scolymus]